MLLSEVFDISERKNKNLIDNKSIKKWFNDNDKKRKYLTTGEKAIMLNLIEQFLQKDEKNSVIAVTNYIVKDLIKIGFYLGITFNEFDFDKITKNIIEIYDSLLESGIIDMVEEYSISDIKRFDDLYDNYLKLETESVLREFVSQINNIKIDNNLISLMSDFMKDENFMKTLDMFSISQDKETKDIVNIFSDLSRKEAKHKMKNKAR